MPVPFPGEKWGRHGASLRANPTFPLGFPFSYTLLRIGGYRVLFEVEAAKVIINRVKHRSDAYGP